MSNDYRLKIDTRSISRGNSNFITHSLEFTFRSFTIEDLPELLSSVDEVKKKIVSYFEQFEDSNENQL